MSHGRPTSEDSIEHTADRSLAHLLDGPRWSASALTFAAVLTAAAVLGLVSRAWLLGEKSIWLDEAWSWRAAELSLSAMIDRTRADVHPPLYYGVLHFWVEAFGDSEASLRTPSILAGVGSIVLATFAGWRLGGPLIAGLAAALLILNPADLQFTQEARMYPVVGFLSMATALLLWRVIENSNPVWLAGYIVAAVALAYTHYSGFAVLGMQGLVFLWFGIRTALSGRDWRILIAVGVAGTAVVLGYIPWWSTFFSQSGHGVGHVPDASVTLAGATLRAALGLRQTRGLWLILAIPLTAAIVYGVWRRRDEPLVICLFATALVPVALFVVSVLVKPAFDIKRCAPFIPPIAVLSALGIAEATALAGRIDERWRGLAFGATLGGVFALGTVMVMGSIDWYRAGPYEDWRAVARDVAAVEGPVFYFEDYLNDPLGYYVTDPGRLVAISAADERSVFGAVVVANGRVPSDQATLIVSHASDEHARSLRELMAGTYGVVGEHDYGDSIKLYELRRKKS